MSKWVSVSKEELDTFINCHPNKNKLRWEVSETYGSPVASYIDSSLGQWPDNIVAKVKLTEGNLGDDLNEYLILKGD